MKFCVSVGKELSNAREHYPRFNSAHEGYAVILEEMHELWAEVMKKPKDRNAESMRLECIQIAAMAQRFYEDVIDTERYREI